MKFQFWTSYENEILIYKIRYGEQTSAKKDILLQSQQIQKQEYPTFEFVFQ